MPNIKAQLQANRADLQAERAGLPSDRATQRDIAALAQPDTAPVVTPVAITTAIKGGGAMADLMGVMEDAGLITNQSTMGTDPIIPLSDSVSSLDALTSNGFVVRTGPGSYLVSKLVTYSNGLTVIHGDGNPSTSGSLSAPPGYALQALINSISFLGDSGSPGTPGIIVSDGVGNAAARTLTAGSSNIVITNGNGAGTPTIDLASSIVGSVIHDGISQDAADNPSTTATTTYQVLCVKAITLPAGTWSLRVALDLRATHGVGGNVSLKINVGGTASGTTWSGGSLSAARTLAAPSAAPGSWVGMSTTIAGITGGGAVNVFGGYVSSGGNTATASGPRLLIDATRTA